MSSIESRIKGSQKLTDIYGEWPSFRDGWLEELCLRQGDVFKGGPFIAAKIHIRAERPASDETLATLRFEGVDDVNIKASDLQYLLLGISITVEERGMFDYGDTPPPHLIVEFRGKLRTNASFRCVSIEVVDAVPD